MKFNWVDPKTLKPHPKNPNKHSPEQIKRLIKLIRAYGWRHPLIVSNQSGFIIVGNGRHTAALEDHILQVPVHYQDFKDESEEYGFMVADNGISEWAELDLAAINIEIPSLGPNFDVDWLGLKDFVVEPADKYGDKDANEVPEVEKPFVKSGELWILGGHRLLCGDATDKDSVERLMNGERADMVLTDPPYNVGSDSKNYAADVSDAMNTLKGAEWDKDFDIIPALDRIKECVKKDATIYVWTSQFLIQKIWDHLGGWCDFIGYCVWNKPNPMPSLSKRHWTWNTELCVYGTIGSKRTVNFPDGSHALSTWTFTKKSDGSHPTQKPIELLEHPINFSSGPENLILDLFLGSGSTLIACEKTNRKCFGSEIDPHYCSVIIERYIKFVGNDDGVYLCDGKKRTHISKVRKMRDKVPSEMSKPK